MLQFKLKDQLFMSINSLCCSHADDVLRYWQTRTHCCGHIVGHNVSWARKRTGHRMNTVFPCCANSVGNICCGHKMFLNKIRNIFCVPDTKFVSRAGKRGNICVGNNVSATMSPRLPGPLKNDPVRPRFGKNYISALLD